MSGLPQGGPPGQNPGDKDKDKKAADQKKKWEPPLPTRVGKKKKRGPDKASKLPPVFPTTRCRLRLLKMERIKDYLLLEEEFILNQERLKPDSVREEKSAAERSRVDQLRGSPMAVGTLEEIIDDDHAIVSTSTGPESYVSILSIVDKDMLEPGCSVLLNHKNQAIVGVLQDDADPMVNVMKLDKAPTESYADIGGLETQIQEIKVRGESSAPSSDSLTKYIGIRRASTYTSRAVRGDGYQAAKRCHPLWCARDGQDPSCEGRCEPDVCDIPAHRRLRAHPKVSWRRS
jgi:26S proteasome regulatory subunit T2